MFSIKRFFYHDVDGKPVAKRGRMLDLINNDRKNNGLSPVVLGSNNAAHTHAQEMADNDYLSHWGLDGMKPYMRYTLAGGFNYEGENTYYSTYGSTTWRISGVPVYTTVNRNEPKEDLAQAEKSWMGSPGHRRNILNRWHKKVNLGIAWGEKTFAAVQQFEGDYMEFTKLPTLSGNALSMAGKLNLGTIDSIALYYDSLPQPLTPKQLDGPRSYSLGDEVGYVLPPPPPGSFYTKVPANSVVAKQWNVTTNGQFAIEADITSSLKQGKGVYTVVIWANVNNGSKNMTNYSIFVR